ncbi:MAG: 1-(5-phosphoribosyl)-5-[(5-phosphoribosylamino)methylideneamino] imidazole-4-carboxamide isomerase [Acidimicrobiales bacterium]|nr:MAG: 1-(5-phosphoribosyl)-5-[(5-phosphoribosylamino)methylideneamino]imidazole-4-carboxamide isomerase [Actinomycetota bacterium]MBV6509561.1 1-(5-phosphoribosyl)-5-[(5-phosphoribosylamino)methylideneamino] imidazole-4-carboxamide isomerase [Acidimicrobiales bacterium]RIK06577.1 MAG: 1-(5-phosphoribosyl)-5-[(5-phosphoribosylamino)methylideneamino]imidazole-4-carboxamide isomerase [Acidobacteriota bacterium]
MDLYPAIDLLDGRCVRLEQGDYGRETRYGDDPVAQAEQFAAAGAPWIHVVDLDAARSGVAANREVIASIVTAVDVPVQAGGGVRDEAAAAALFESGVARVVIGTAALRDPDLVRRIALRQPVAVGLDARGGEVAVEGWTEGSGQGVLEVAARFEDTGVEALVVTDIGRDGMLVGPDIEGLATLLEATSLDVIASGGVGGLGDLRALARLGSGRRRLAGVICGRAIYVEAFTVQEALAVLDEGS